MILSSALSSAHSIADLRELAQRRLPRSVFEFIDGGAEDETTLRANRRAFEALRLRPRVLVDVARPTLSIDLLGQQCQAPLVVAPMGSCALVWPETDTLLATAAREAGIPYTLSTMANTKLETLADTVGGRLWFQLYVLRDTDFNFRLIDRAHQAGYEALVVTVDLPTGGKRERDLRNGISIPLSFQPRHALEALTHPGWALQMARTGSPQFDNVRELMDRDTSGLTIAAKVGRNLNAAFNWDDMQRIRDRWPGPLLIKGVEHPQDAARLVAMGADGIWISNHGGRQLDGAMASLDAVPAIAAEVNDRATIILDSGVRRGVDLLKAKAMGVTACAVGRASLYGAAAAGQPGAHRAIDILTDELKRAMRLTGIADIADASDDILQTNTP